MEAVAVPPPPVAPVVAPVAAPVRPPVPRRLRGDRGRRARSGRLGPELRSAADPPFGAVEHARQRTLLLDEAAFADAGSAPHVPLLDRSAVSAPHAFAPAPFANAVSGRASTDRLGRRLNIAARTARQRRTAAQVARNALAALPGTVLDASGRRRTPRGHGAVEAFLFDGGNGALDASRGRAPFHVARLGLALRPLALALRLPLGPRLRTIGPMPAVVTTGSSRQSRARRAGQQQ